MALGSALEGTGSRTESNDHIGGSITMSNKKTP